MPLMWHKEFTYGMKDTKDEKINIISIVFLLIAVVTLFARIRNIYLPVVSDYYHSFRTTETAIVIQDFFRNGFSFFNYSMPLFGKPWNVMFEFPTYQALVYGVMRLTGATNIDFCARVVSIVIFYGSALILVYLTSYITDKCNALCVGIFYLLSFYNLYWSSAVLIDYLSVLFALIYLLCLCMFVKDNKLSAFCIGMISGIIGYMTKGTTFFPIVFLAAIYIIKNETRVIFSRKEKSSILIKEYIGNHIKRITGIAFIALVPALCGLVWNGHADKLKNMSVYTSWISLGNSKQWYYGTIQQKLSWENWKVIFERYECFFGNRWILLVVVIAYFTFSTHKYWKVVVVSFAAQLVSIFVLFNLFYIHNYYLIELVPFVYMMFGTMIYELFEIKMKYRFTRGAMIVVAFIIFIAFQVMNNNVYFAYALYEFEVKESTGTSIDRISTDNELVVVLDEDWSPMSLYDSNRRGFLVRDNNMLYDESFRDFLKDDNYTTYITHTDKGVEAIKELDNETEQYVFESKSELKEKKFIFKNIENSDTCECSIKANNDTPQALSDISDGESFIIKYACDRTAGIYGYIIDKNNVLHDFVIVLPANKKMVKINYSLVSSEAEYIVIDKSEEFEIEYVY